MGGVPSGRRTPDHRSSCSRIEVSLADPSTMNRHGRRRPVGDTTAKAYLVVPLPQFREEGGIEQPIRDVPRPHRHVRAVPWVPVERISISDPARAADVCTIAAPTSPPMSSTTEPISLVPMMWSVSRRVRRHGVTFGLAKPLYGMPRYGKPRGSFSVFFAVRSVPLVGETEADLAGRRIGGEARDDVAKGCSGNGSQLNGGHVVEDPTTVRESGQVQSQQPQVAGRLGRRDRRVEPEQVRLHPCAVVVGEGPGDHPAGIPVSKIASRSGLVLGDPALYAARSGTHQGRGRQELWQQRVWRSSCRNWVPSAVRWLHVPLVLVADADEELIDQRVAEPGDLGPRPAPGPSSGPLPQTRTRCRLAVVHTPMTAAGSLGPLGAAAGQLAGGICSASECTLTSAVEFTPGMPFMRPAAGATGVVTSERAQVTEVEDRAQVDVEAFGPLTGEHLGRGAPALTAWTAAAARRRVVRCRQRSDVARRAQQADAEQTDRCRPPIAEV